MDYIAPQTIRIARFAREATAIEDDVDDSHVKGWLTQVTPKEKGKSTPWVLRVLPAHAEEVNADHSGTLCPLLNSRNVGCIKGIALLEASVAVSSLGENRPEFLFRAVHGGQPYGGITSRLNRGSDDVFFHHHLRRHLSWISREPSPFLSATTSFKKAIRVACIYVAKGYSDVRIIKFKTRGAGWDHEKQRIWEPRKLVHVLSPQDDRRYFDHELLIEHSIPGEAITKTYEWEKDQYRLDPSGNSLGDAAAVRKARDDAKKRRQDKAREAREAREAKEKSAADDKAKEDDASGNKVNKDGAELREEADRAVKNDDMNILEMKKRTADALIDHTEQEQETGDKGRKRYKISDKLTYHLRI